MSFPKHVTLMIVLIGALMTMAGSALAQEEKAASSASKSTVAGTSTDAATTASKPQESDALAAETSADKNSEAAPATESTTDASAATAEASDAKVTMEPTPEAGDTTHPSESSEKTEPSAPNAATAPVGSSPAPVQDAKPPGGVKDVQDVDILAPPPAVDNFTAKAIPYTDRIVNVHTTQTVRHGALTLVVDHRAHDTFLSGEEAFFDYLGLDAGNLKIGFGLRLGLKKYMDLGFYRLSNGTDLFDVYQFDTKMRFLNQDDAYVNASLQIGGTWFVQNDAEDAAGFLAQVNVDRRLFGTLFVGTGFAFHSNSSNDKKYYTDDDPSGAVLGYVEWRPIRRFSINLEMAANVVGYGSKYPVFAFAPRFLTHRHSFSLVVANSQYMSGDGLVSNTWRGFDELVFGFQIVREFNLVN
ncbi:MAG: hypothetical protein JXR76_13490 [Deltaproteobacteria bacterium]|nr:hypothetical protein [Deltaproteobacteria bacterium]